MGLEAKRFFHAAEEVVKKVEDQKLVQRRYSDVLDGEGHQYVDLVMEGGGVLGIALAGYVYILEKAGLRFVGVGGASAGSITALVLAAIGTPDQAKGEKLVEILANIPMVSFMDGREDGDNDAPDFINTMLKRPGLGKGLWKAMQVLDNLEEMQGLNRGDRFHQWLKATLAELGIETTDGLKQRMATTPAGWHLRKDSDHRASQLGKRLELSPLEPHNNYLCMVTGDIATETKVEFPRMADLYWDNAGAVNPADFARCSMSIPVFFKPYRVPLKIRNQAHLDQWRTMAGLNERDTDPAREPAFPPPEACFIDGGVLSNFPIDVFHNTEKVPTRPTLGVKLQWDERSHEINKLSKLVTQTFNSARHCLDYEFIRKNPDFKQLVTYIDTADHDWLNFEMKPNDQIDLFVRGAQAAYDFLNGFDWQGYKTIRAHMVGAYEQAEKSKKAAKAAGATANGPADPL